MTLAEVGAQEEGAMNQSSIVREGFASEVELLDAALSVMTAGEVASGYAALVSGLEQIQRYSSAQRWSEFVAVCRRHPVQLALRENAHVDRSLARPRGYAGDAVQLDFIYEGFAAAPPMTPFGRSVFQVQCETGTSQAVRAR